MRTSNLKQIDNLCVHPTYAPSNINSEILHLFENIFREEISPKALKRCIEIARIKELVNLVNEINFHLPNEKIILTMDTSSLLSSQVGKILKDVPERLSEERIGLMVNSLRGSGLWKVWDNFKQIRICCCKTAQKIADTLNSKYSNAYLDVKMALTNPDPVRNDSEKTQQINHTFDQTNLQAMLLELEVAKAQPTDIQETQNNLKATEIISTSQPLLTPGDNYKIIPQTFSEVTLIKPSAETPPPPPLADSNIPAPPPPPGSNVPLPKGIKRPEPKKFEGEPIMPDVSLKNLSNNPALFEENKKIIEKYIKDFKDIFDDLNTQMDYAKSLADDLSAKKKDLAQLIREIKISNNVIPLLKNDQPIDITHMLPGKKKGEFIEKKFPYFNKETFTTVNKQLKALGKPEIYETYKKKNALWEKEGKLVTLQEKLPNLQKQVTDLEAELKAITEAKHGNIDFKDYTSLMNVKMALLGPWERLLRTKHKDKAPISAENIVISSKEDDYNKLLQEYPDLHLFADIPISIEIQAKKNREKFYTTMGVNAPPEKKDEAEKISE